MPVCYRAYASFGVKCIVAPKVPNNEGSLSVIRVTAPEDSILNARKPAPVAARHVTTRQMLPDVMFGCPAPGVGRQRAGRGARRAAMDLFALGGPGSTDDDPSETVHAQPFSVMSFHAGGTGARPGADGLSATAFPSGVKNVPIEVNEAVASPIVVLAQGIARIRAVPASSAAGWARSWRSARSTRHRLRSVPTTTASTIPRGRDGGRTARRHAHLASGKGAARQGLQTVTPKDRVIIAMPGGGGLGDRAGARSPRWSTMCGASSRAGGAPRLRR